VHARDVCRWLPSLVPHYLARIQYIVALYSFRKKKQQRGNEETLEKGKGTIVSSNWYAWLVRRSLAHRSLLDSFIPLYALASLIRRRIRRDFFFFSSFSIATSVRRSSFVVRRTCESGSFLPRIGGTRSDLRCSGLVTAEDSFFFFFSPIVLRTAACSKDGLALR